MYEIPFYWPRCQTIKVHILLYGCIHLGFWILGEYIDQKVSFTTAEIVEQQAQFL